MVHAPKKFLTSWPIGRFLFLERRQLFVTEIATLQIGHQSVNASGNMPDMESDRSKSMRRRPNLFRLQPVRIFRQILARLLEAVQERRQQGIYSGNRPSRPGFE